MDTLTVEEVAAICGVSAPLVKRWVKRRTEPQFSAFGFHLVPWGKREIWRASNLDAIRAWSADRWSEFRPIPGQQGYFASADGRIRNECGRQLSVRLQGRTRVVSLNRSKSTIVPVASLVAITYLGPMPPGCRMYFRDGDRSNCRADNLLYLGSHLKQCNHCLQVKGVKEFSPSTKGRQRVAAYCRRCSWPRERDRHADQFFKLRANGGWGVSAQELATLWNAQSGRCALTGAPLGPDAHLDHILPRSRGGTSDPSNLRWLTPTANRLKGNLLDVELLELCAVILRHATPKNQRNES